MPKRTNKFQQLIYLIHSQLTDCKVVESAPFVDRRSGEQREVDIAIFSKIANYPVVIGIECRDHKRPQSSTWVEEMWAKHQALSTTSLVLVSSSGFYKPALKTASALGIEALTFEQATPEFWPSSLPRLRRLKLSETYKIPVRFTLIPDEAWLPKGLQASVLAGLSVHTSDGIALGTLKEVFDKEKDKIQLDSTRKIDLLKEGVLVVDVRISLVKGTYLLDEAGQKRTLREMIFRLQFEGYIQDINPQRYQLNDKFVGLVDSDGKYSEATYTIVTKDKFQCSAGVLITKWKKPPACIWDICIPSEYYKDEMGKLRALNYQDSSQFKSSGKPSPGYPELPKLSIRLNSL